MRRLSLIFAVLSVAACGTKGPLTLPPKNLPPPKPAQSAPATAQPAPESAATSPDNSSKPPTGTAQ